MGLIPPPLPLSRSEFNKRYAAGARTLAELDPDFIKWYRGNMLQRIIFFMAVAAGISWFIYALAFSS